MQDLNKLIENVDNALWEMQEYFNAQPKEEIDNYLGTCRNLGALKVYQLRCQIDKFPRKHISLVKLDYLELVDFLRDYYAEPTSLRLGQAFCNKYKITNPALFYATKDNDVMNIIFAEYCRNPEDSPTEEEQNYIENFGLDQL